MVQLDFPPKHYMLFQSDLMVKASQIPSLNRTQDTDSMLLAGKSVCLHTNGTKGVYIWMSLSPISLEKGFDFSPPPLYYTNRCFITLLLGWPRRPWNVGIWNLPTRR